MTAGLFAAVLFPPLTIGFFLCAGLGSRRGHWAATVLGLAVSSAGCVGLFAASMASTRPVRLTVRIVDRPPISILQSRLDVPESQARWAVIAAVLVAAWATCLSVRNDAGPALLLVGLALFACFAVSPYSGFAASIGATGVFMLTRGGSVGATVVCLLIADFVLLAMLFGTPNRSRALEWDWALLSAYALKTAAFPLGGWLPARSRFEHRPAMIFVPVVSFLALRPNLPENLLSSPITTIAMAAAMLIPLLAACSERLLNARAALLVSGLLPLTFWMGPLHSDAAALTFASGLIGAAFLIAAANTENGYHKGMHQWSVAAAITLALVTVVFAGPMPTFLTTDGSSLPKNGPEWALFLRWATTVLGGVLFLLATLVDENGTLPPEEKTVNNKTPEGVDA